MGLIDFRPIVRVTIEGEPLSGFAFSQLSSVRVTDTAGVVSDTAEITVANVSALNRFSMPDPDAEVKIELGYLFGFRDMGVFIADEIEESGPPRQITATCRAKAQGETSNGMAPIQQHKTRSWAAGLTLKAIASKMASDNGLEPAVTDAAAAIVPGHIDQIDESDIAVLTRVAFVHDLIAKPAGDLLLFLQHQQGLRTNERSNIHAPFWCFSPQLKPHLTVNTVGFLDICSPALPLKYKMNATTPISHTCFTNLQDALFSAVGSVRRDL